MEPLFKEEVQARKDLKDLLNKLEQISPESLVRTDELGTSLDFKIGISVFKRTLDLFGELKGSSLDRIPGNVLTLLVGAANSTLETFELVRRFDTSGQNPSEQRDRLVKNIADQYKVMFERVSPVIAYSESKALDFKQIEQDAKKSLDEVHQVQRSLRVQSKQIIANAQSALENLKSLHVISSG